MGAILPAHCQHNYLPKFSYISKSCWKFFLQGARGYAANLRPAEGSDQFTQQWIWGTIYPLKELLMERTGARQSALRKRVYPPHLECRRCTPSPTCGMALRWKYAPVWLGLTAWGTPTSGLVGTWVEAPPSQGWPSLKVSVPIGAGVFCVFSFYFIFYIPSCLRWWLGGPSDSGRAEVLEGEEVPIPTPTSYRHHPLHKSV